MAVLGSLFLAISRILQGKLLKNKESDEKVFSFAFQITVGLILLVLALINGFDFSGYENYYPNIILMVFLYSIAGVGLAYAFKKGEVSNILIISASTTVWAFLFSLIILNEEVTIAKLVSLLLIFLALVISNYKEGSLKINKASLIALLSSVLLGLAFVNDAYIIGDRDLLSYISVAFILPGLMTLIIFPKTIVKVKQFVKPKLIISLLLVATTYALSNILGFSAYQAGGDVSVISPINASSTILAVILAIIFFKERDNLKLKSIAIILTAIGLILFSLVI